MKNTFLALISVAVILFASSASAGDYMSGKVGLYSPEEDDFLDNGINVEAVYGMDISRMIGIENTALEFGLGYYTADGDFTISETIPFVGTITTKTEAEISAIPVTVTGIYTLNLNGPFNLYGGAGLGAYYVMQEVEISDPFFGTLKADDDEFKLGIHVVGGAQFELNDLMALIAELKYASVSDDTGGVFFNIGLKYNF